jgi:hypothetical protein
VCENVRQAPMGSSSCVKRVPEAAYSFDGRTLSFDGCLEVVKGPHGES